MEIINYIISQVGGLDLKVQEKVLRGSPDIVIATPGRLIDHLKNTPSFRYRWHIFCRPKICI